jgi:hypothetical protein
MLMTKKQTNSTNSGRTENAVPTKGAALAASWLACCAYIIGLVLAFLSFSNSQEINAAWCHGPGITNHSVQFAIAGVVLGLVGLLVSQAYAPKYVRYIGIMTIILCVLIPAAGMLSFHICF